MRQLSLFVALQFGTQGIDTQFKSAHGVMTGSFWQSYAAMANIRGCAIVLGVVVKASGLVWEWGCFAAHSISIGFGLSHLKPEDSKISL
jgi:hypothetical protein